MNTQEQADRKLPHLEYLFKKHGDFDIFFASFDEMKDALIPLWPAWKKYSECSAAELKESNLRQVLPSEIVLDCDAVNPQEVRNKLIAEGYAFLMYAHRYEPDGVIFRNNHFHLFFPQLKDMTPEKRTLVRKAFIKTFGCDQSKSSNRNVIATEFTPHWKCGILKILVEHYGE